MYSFDSRVRYSECDESGELSIHGLVNYLQDCSTFHSESLGVGLYHMASEHYAWLISTWEIEIARLPRFGEKIRISTWCHEMRGAQAHRCFTIEDDEGRSCVRADSHWFAYDTQLSRPIRIPAGQEGYLTGEGRLDLPPLQRKIAVEGAFVAIPEVTVTRQLLDTNRHVNNARYIQLALDALEAAGTRLSPRRICVQYKTMALLGERIAPRVHNGQDSWTVDLTRTGTDESFAVVRLEGVR
ncbi:acyl-[acyl-carrier-protein] thioesterase [Olsenella urininfantis]|uniref:acyl-[acyl-carrier-protein] thioesterase n=1 Tax=Olsenella urininfantis TaxID=1871033 RepID=UPI000986A9D4|nr:acyl-ACP thioesterase domain-containing protein [Olsenella urininfantis]